MNQLKNAFGFTNSPPQAGQAGYDYNYQLMKWYVICVCVMCVHVFLFACILWHSMLSI